MYKDIAPVEEERWEEVIDFTKIKKGGVDIDELLAYLWRYGQNRKSAAEASSKRKRDMRVIFRKTKTSIKILELERRSDTIYNKY